MSGLKSARIIVLFTLTFLLSAGGAVAYTPAKPKPWTEAGANGRYVLSMKKSRFMDKKKVKRLKKEIKRLEDELKGKQGRDWTRLHIEMNYKKNELTFESKDTENWTLTLYRKKGQKRRRIWTKRLRDFAYPDRFFIAPDGGMVAFIEQPWGSTHCGSLKLLRPEGDRDYCLLDQLTAEERTRLPWAQALALGKKSKRIRNSRAGRETLFWLEGLQFERGSRVLTAQIAQSWEHSDTDQFGSIALHVDTKTGGITRGELNTAGTAVDIIRGFKSLKKDYDRQQAIIELKRLCSLAPIEEREATKNFFRRLLRLKSLSGELVCLAMNGLESTEGCNEDDSTGLAAHLGRNDCADMAILKIMKKGGDKNFRTTAKRISENPKRSAEIRAFAREIAGNE